MSEIDLRLILRRLASRPGFTLLVILPLGLVIGAATAVFSVVDQTVLRPAPFAFADRLVDVLHLSGPNGGGGNNLSMEKIAGWQGQPAMFERFEAYAPLQMDLTGGAEPVRGRGLQVSLGLFSMLGVSPILGRSFGEGDGRPGSDRVVIISELLWQTRFGGSSDALGRRLTLNDEDYTIVGVMPRRFRLLRDDMFWLPVEVTAYLDDTTLRGFYGLGRLAPGVRMPAAREMANDLAARLQREAPIAQGWYLGLEQKQIARVDTTTRTTLLVVLGAVGFVLLIACANVANLFLAQAPARQREMAIRSALGAGRRRLVASVLLESTLLAIVGGALGVVLAHWGVAAVVALAPDRFAFMTTSTIEVDARVVGAAAIMTFVSGLLFGVLPAVRGSRPRLESTLRGSASAGSRVSFGRIPAALVIVEVAFSLILLVGAALMMRTLVRLHSIDAGFEPSGLIAMHLDLPSDRYPTAAARIAFFDALIARLSSTPGIAAAAAATGVPPAQGGFTSGVPETDGGIADTGQVIVPFNTVSPGYFATIGIPLVAGRHFTARSAPDELIVSRGFADRFWPNGDAVGKRFRFGTGRPESTTRDRWLTIVGVVENVETRSAHEDRTTMQIYYPWVAVPAPAATPAAAAQPRRRSFDYRLLIVRATDPMGSLPEIRRHVSALDPNQPVEQIALVEDMYAEAFARQRFMLTLMGGFSFIALILTAAGIFSVLSHAVSQRTREIGIRLAIGARPASVMQLVLSRGLLLATAGAAIGVAGAAALSQVLQTLLFEVSATDPVSFGVVTGLMILVALAACWFPARTAMRVEPAVTLRSE